VSACDGIVAEGVHFAVSAPTVMLSDLDMVLDMPEHVRGRARLEGGARLPGEGPGFGISHDYDRIRALARIGAEKRAAAVVRTRTAAASISRLSLPAQASVSRNRLLRRDRLDGAFEVVVPGQAQVVEGGLAKGLVNRSRSNVGVESGGRAVFAGFLRLPRVRFPCWPA
jgi:hypothetical protein